MGTNEERQLANIQQVIRLVEPDFVTLANIHNAVNFQREISFALQMLKNNSYLMSVAAGDQDSLKSAILNVAAIGLSLSPVHKLAYLVPRGKKVCLDISYRGYTQLGVDVGAIKWAIAELVCEKDKFELRGRGVEPLHNFQPFGNRGKILGGYCISKTHDSEFLTITMPIAEIHAIRDRTESWIAYKKDNAKKCPWVTDESEMIKKTIIRRAYKSWPMTDTRRRLDDAIEISDAVDPMDFAPERASANVASHELPRAQELLKQLDRSEEQFVGHLVRVFKRDLKKLEDLTEMEMNQAVVMLEGILAEKLKKTEIKEVTNEVAG